MSRKEQNYKTIAIDRLVIFIRKKRKSFREFEFKVGLSNGYISKQQKRKGAVGSNVLEKIICQYPELNIMWLLTGTQKMIVNDMYGMNSRTKLGREAFRISA